MSSELSGTEAQTGQPIARENEGTGYAVRMVLFHAIWVGVFLLVYWILSTVAPSPDVDYAYFLAFLPLSYGLLLIIFAPISAGIGLIVRWAIPRSGWRPRVIALLITVTVWTALFLVLFASASASDRRIGDAIVLAVSALVFGLFMPLPWRRPTFASESR